MSEILDKIVEQKKEHVEKCKEKVPLEQLKNEIEEREAYCSFPRCLRESNDVSLIAEIKPCSPSAGQITDLPATEIASVYQASAPAAVSVLTDEPYFGQDLEVFKKVRRILDKPLLRKEFMIDRYQIYEAAAAGADAILLIVSLLSREQLSEFNQLCNELNLTPLVEIHNRRELEKLTFIPSILGINNRQLEGDFTTDLDQTKKVLQFAPENSLIVSESGIKTKEDFDYLRKLGGVDAALVGTSLLKEAETPAEIEQRIVRLIGHDT